MTLYGAAGSKPFSSRPRARGTLGDGWTCHGARWRAKDRSGKWAIQKWVFSGTLFDGF